MRKLALLLLLSGSLAFGQAKPVEPTPAELKAQLAEAKQKIAELQQQVLELQITVQIAEKAALPQIDQARQQAAQEVQKTKEAAIMARAAAEAEKTPKTQEAR